jgi:hypothetical protein
MATGDLASRGNSGMQDIQSLLGIFKGGAKTTQSTFETVSSDKANAYIKQIMESSQGLAAVSSGQKGAGLYNSSTNQLLTNDLLSRTAGQTAALSSAKTTSTQTGKQADVLGTLLGVGGGALGSALLGPALKTGAKKLGVDKWGQEISDSIFGSAGTSMGSIGESVGDIYPAAFDSVAVDAGVLGDMSFMDSVTAGAGGDAAAAGAAGEGGASIGAGEVAALGAGGALIGSALAGAGTAAGATAGGYAIAAGATEFAATAATAAEGAGVVDAIITAIALWIVCTELRKQSRMPQAHYVYGARKFATYDDAIKRGYYVWAIPSTKHLRENPCSAYSKFLEVLFCNRAEYLAAQENCKGARKTVAGFVATYATHGVCWILSRTIARKPYTLEQIKGHSHA